MGRRVYFVTITSACGLYSSGAYTPETQWLWNLAINKINCALTTTAKKWRKLSSKTFFVTFISGTPSHKNIITTTHTYILFFAILLLLSPRRLWKLLLSQNFLHVIFGVTCLHISTSLRPDDSLNALAFFASSQISTTVRVCRVRTEERASIWSITSAANVHQGTRGLIVNEVSTVHCHGALAVKSCLEKAKHGPGNNVSLMTEMIELVLIAFTVVAAVIFKNCPYFMSTKERCFSWTWCSSDQWLVYIFSSVDYDRLAWIQEISLKCLLKTCCGRVILSKS